jgi:head-tail adaptor
MIAAGLLNKTITVQHLHMTRDEYGSDIEEWRDILKCKAYVKGFDGKSLTSTGSEIIMEDRLLFTVRRVERILFDRGNRYRVLYGNKIYNVLGINSEDRDIITIMTALRND